MSSSRPVFRSRWLPYVLVAPQLIITLIFFIWPAGEALWYSLQSVDPFGLSSQFVGLDNFVALFHDPYYLDSFWTTIKFSALVTVSGLLISLFFAALVDYVVRGSRFYQTLMLLPYAVAPAVAAVLWIFLFNPGRGLITHFLGELGYDWNHAQNSGQAMFLVVFASVWKQISYNFLFFFAALQSIPRSLVEAAAIDGARADSPLLQAGAAADCAGEFLPAGGQPGLRLLRYLPGDRCRHRRRPGAGDHHPNLQNLSRRFRRARSFRFRRAVGGADVPRHYPDGGAVPLR